MQCGPVIDSDPKHRHGVSKRSNKTHPTNAGPQGTASHGLAAIGEDLRNRTAGSPSSKRCTTGHSKLASPPSDNQVERATIKLRVTMPLQDWPTTGGNLLTRHARRLPWLTGMLFVLTSHLTAAL